VLGVDGVLDVDADGARLQHSLDELGRGGVVAGLHVRRDGDVHSPGDAGDAGEGLVEAHLLAVAGAQRVGEGVAADGQRLEAGLDGGTGGPGVPHGGEHDGGRLVMEGEQGLGACAQLCHAARTLHPGRAVKGRRRVALGRCTPVGRSVGTRPARRRSVRHDGRIRPTPIAGDPMALALDPTPALHTWSLFRTMGRYVAPGSAPSGALAENTDGGGLPLLELPAQLAAHGFASAQLCHFYLPTTEASYLAELRAAFDAAGVDLEVLLVDDGDVVHPEHGREQQRWLGSWLDVAEQLGTPRVRVPAGDQLPSEETLALGAARLRELAAEHPDLRVLTENWRGLLVDAAATRRLLDLLEGEVGLL